MKKIAIIAFAGFIGLTSCVSKKKYTALETQNTQTEGELSTAKMELASCLDKQKASKTEVDYLKSVNYKLLESNSSLSTLSAQESANLEKSLESLSQKERQVKSLQSALNKKDSVMFALVSSLKGEFIAADDEDIQIEVEKGGTITWNGLASNADLNLKAIYKSKANPSALLDDPTINRKIPVDVYIDLTDKITQPELLFDIDFPEVSSTVRSELEYKLQTQEEREKQALFLLTTGSFISETAGQSAISGTVTDGVNAILAQILTDDDAVINIAPYYDMGIDTKEIETQDEFGVQFSSQISERIVVNGKVGIPVGKINESRVAGDVDVQWLVNEDGSLRINFFNRQAELQFIGEDQTFEQGAGVSYQVDFDTIKNLMDKLFGLEVDLIPEENLVPMDNK